MEDVLNGRRLENAIFAAYHQRNSHSAVKSNGGILSEFTPEENLVSETVSVSRAFARQEELWLKARDSGDT
jgi:hypothetical protein